MKYNWSKKTSHFPRQLKVDFEAFFKRTRKNFGQKYNDKMLKTQTKANFVENCLNRPPRLLLDCEKKKRIALRTDRCME